MYNTKMAFCRTGAFILKFIKPSLTNPCFNAPGSVNMQVRYAARKGYREKVRREKREMKKNAPVVKVPKVFQARQKVFRYEKTINLKKPEAPNDDIIMRDNFNYIKYSLSDAVKMHREYHHPTVYNNPKARVNVSIEVSMYGKSQFSFIKPFSGIVSIPHPFVILHKKEVLVLCNTEDINLALSCGASLAGGEEVIKKIKEGVVQPSLFDYVIAHVSILPKLIPIRTLLKNQMPKAKEGSLTNDLKASIYKFLHGIEYSCVTQSSINDTGFVNCCIGLIDMELEHLEENLKALVKDIEQKRPPREGDFITWIWCSSPPSNEKFSLDLSKYTTVKKFDVDDDEEEVEIQEKEARYLVKTAYEAQNLLKENLKN